MPEDRVQMPSIAKDGSYDQSENFEITGDKQAAKDALARSLAQNATAQSGAARAEAQAAEAAGETALSPDEQARKDEIDSHVSDAESEAESLVESRWVDPAARQAAPEQATSRRGRRSASSDES